MRVREALETVEALVGKLTEAIRAASSVALATSVLVLAGALAANRRARMADAVIFKILGATRGRLIATFLIEYATLGVATAAFGVGAGTLAAYVIVAKVMGFDFEFDAGPGLGRRRRRPGAHRRFGHDRGLAHSGTKTGRVLAEPLRPWRSSEPSWKRRI